MVLFYLGGDCLANNKVPAQQTFVNQWGNSLGVRLSVPLANALGIKRDSRVSIKFDAQQKCLILRKL